MSKPYAADHRYKVRRPDTGAILEQYISTARSQDVDMFDAETLKSALKEQVKNISQRQRLLYADGRFSLLLVFQALDAAGKDSTIRHVFSGVNPAGFQVHSFKQPSKEELAHHFLWRSTKRQPRRGFIGVFNRSYYEETLVVRVHPEYLQAQNIPHTGSLDELWQRRFEAIRQHEHSLYHSGTIVLKFFLNVSRHEQHKRLLARLNSPQKNWKFSAADVHESAQWPKYMHAYEQVLQHTNQETAPWYVIPADNKRYMRLQVATIVAETLNNLPLSYPQLNAPAVDVARWKDEIKEIIKQTQSN